MTGRTVSATLAGRDPSTDLAVLRIQEGDYFFIQTYGMDFMYVDDEDLRKLHRNNHNVAASKPLTDANHRAGISNEGMTEPGVLCEPFIQLNKAFRVAIVESFTALARAVRS